MFLQRDVFAESDEQDSAQSNLFGPPGGVDDELSELSISSHARRPPTSSGIRRPASSAGTTVPAGRHNLSTAGPTSGRHEWDELEHSQQRASTAAPGADRPQSASIREKLRQQRSQIVERRQQNSRQPSLVMSNDDRPSTASSRSAYVPTVQTLSSSRHQDTRPALNLEVVDRSNTRITKSRDLDPIAAVFAQDQDHNKRMDRERDLLERGIAPIFDPSPSSGPLLMERQGLDLSDMRNFLNKPLPRGLTLQCQIERDKSGLNNKLYPKYYLFMKQDQRFLLAGKKRTKNKTSNYLVSMSKDDLSRSSGNFVGKVRSNFVGTEFVLFDRGVNPKGTVQSAASMATVRQELGVVQYASNILGSRGPRKMKVIVPSVAEGGERVISRPLRPEEAMAVRYKNGDLRDMYTLVNKPPKWNESVGAYVLNFNGRVTMASVKNFQLIMPEDPESVVLQFGRVGKHSFTMDVAWPLSPVQGFGICLSSFDYKIACE